jgi:hypothetical protein
VNTGKKRFLLFLLFLLYAHLNTAFGQPGIKGGLVLSGFQPSQDLKPFLGNDYRPFLGYEIGWIQDDAGDPHIGLQIGFFYSGNISKYFAVQPELYYSQKGIHFYKTEFYNTSYQLKVNFIEIPLLLKYNIPLEWGVKPGLLAGPYAAFKLSANRTLEIWEEKDTRSVSGVKNLDYGLVFAIDAEFSAWSQKLMFEARFNWGLANIMEQPQEFTDLYDDAGTVKILAFTFMTGFRF